MLSAENNVHTSRSSDARDSGRETRILLVDDNEDLRWMLHLLLSNISTCRVVGEAENGLQALEKLWELTVEVVVMDIQMPLMDGIEATREIVTRWPLIRVVGFSSYEHPERVHIMRAGAVECFSKTDIHALVDFLSVFPNDS